jgi:hypothetical protein
VRWLNFSPLKRTLVISPKFHFRAGLRVNEYVSTILFD